MRVADADILIVPSLGNSGPGHWLSRWQSRLSTARRLEGIDFDVPDRALWTEAIVKATAEAKRPVIILAHSIGVIATVHAAPRLTAVAGAFLVGPSDWDRPDIVPGLSHDFAPIPLDPLPFPSVLVASRTDPFVTFERAEEFGFAWGSAFVDAGDAGHIEEESGHGPWPEGLMRLAGFLSKLKA